MNFGGPHHGSCDCAACASQRRVERERLDDVKKTIDEALRSTLPQSAAPRAMTREEVRDQFYDYLWARIEWWDHATRAVTVREKLEGLAHSILVMLDGDAGFLPGFTMCPQPHPNDKQYRLENGLCWYPESGCDIAGDLHEHMLAYGRKRGWAK